MSWLIRISDIQRDIYYSDPACFGSQKVVDTVVDDIAHTIGVNRAALNVEAAAKGLAAGCYRLITKSHEVIDARWTTMDTLIPRLEDIDMTETSNVEWILILEKEAVFHRLARNGYHTRAAAGKGILITGKGYPDIDTRAFVRCLYDSKYRPQAMPRFYALVDGDPDGIAIMSTYKYGSMTYVRENGKLNIPNLQWLGLHISDIAAGIDPQGDDALIRLTARDRKKALAILRNNPACVADGPEQEWRAELQKMLMLNLKAEIEVLYDQDGGLEAWIDQNMTVTP
ncbi:Meiotic recombination protein spo11 [Aspergillus sclerotialis]|uniref:DNA topoisomerase (ATP-hydrolyzing) n=1 Tax=Aspergillus sclerotialis TaxID=2070753 RepID=A0A3A2ZWC4_9EURO|nr:Meiotic recombination protein spo11 [Aspergillus sclerotialis]